MTDRAPRCLYCGYNLTGLEDGARCPECGMVSVPAAFRREVWDLVDSPRRLWGLMARPIAGYPPGWWWALDRPGDVGRSVRTLARNAALSLIIVLSAAVAVDSVVVEETRVAQLYDQADSRAKTLWWNESVIPHRLLNRITDERSTWSNSNFWGGDAYERVRSPARRTIVSYRVLWDWSAGALWQGVAAFAWLLLVWAYVAQVGLWTQIRKGLPEFARPPRTIVAAANLQSCKLVFLAVLAVLGCAVEVASRYACAGRGLHGYELALWGVGAGLALAAATMWIGALRSDFTRQLIRSPIHTGRIVLMYAVALPALTIFAVTLSLEVGTLF